MAGIWDSGFCRASVWSDTHATFSYNPPDFAAAAAALLVVGSKTRDLINQWGFRRSMANYT